MRFVFIDEANPEPTREGNEARFLVYGATIVDADRLVEINEGVEEIRRKYSYAVEDRFKFNLPDKPDHISKEAHR